MKFSVFSFIYYLVSVVKDFKNFLDMHLDHMQLWFYFFIFINIFLSPAISVHICKKWFHVMVLQCMFLCAIWQRTCSVGGILMIGLKVVLKERKYYLFHIMVLKERKYVPNF